MPTRRTTAGAREGRSLSTAGSAPGQPRLMSRAGAPTRAASPEARWPLRAPPAPGESGQRDPLPPVGGPHRPARSPQPTTGRRRDRLVPRRATTCVATPPAVRPAWLAPGRTATAPRQLARSILMPAEGASRTARRDPRGAPTDGPRGACVQAGNRARRDSTWRAARPPIRAIMGNEDRDPRSGPAPPVGPRPPTRPGRT